jgi:microcystin-dependent protein
MLWSGSSASIPSGWLLCDGSSSTPDLRNRFVVGAGSTYAVNATGGSADAIVVSHTHTATVTDPGHLHTYLFPTSIGLAGGGNNLAANTGGSQNTSTATTGITVANSTTGSSGTNANLPPYYALCYIMKS